jgi:PLP dependent protein
MSHRSPIAENIAEIQRRIAATAHRCGRDVSEIALMAATKTQPVESIAAAYEAGIRYFGENRVQEFAAKRDQLSALKGARFSLIGRLQSNKAGRAAELFSEIQSVDSLRIAERLHNLIQQSGRSPLPVLIEINCGDPAKAGMDPDSAELADLLRSAERLTSLRIRGLMTIPPFDSTTEAARPYFRRLRELRNRIAHSAFPQVEMSTLSMGMSHDFEVAIEEGSTCVRIGTAIFGARS